MKSCGSHTGFPVATSGRVARAVAPGSHPCAGRAGASSDLLTPRRRRPLGSSPSLMHVMTSGIAAHHRGTRPSATPVSLLPFAIASTCGPFPPPALPGFTGTTGLSATLSGPTLPSRVVGWRVPRHRQGFPCCAHPPLPCVPPPLPRRNRSVLASLTSRPLAAFPVIQAGRLPHYPFRGLRGVHDIAALMVAEPPRAALCHRSASADVVTSIVRSDCYRLERQLPGGIRTR